MAQRSYEPLLWLSFSTGGVLAALVFPILLLLFGVAFPLGLLEPPSYERLHAVLGHWLTRIALFPLVLFSLLHWAHRFRFTLYDGLQVKHLNELINLFCYGGAIVGSAVALYLLFLL